MKRLQKLGYVLIGSVITATVMLAAPAIAAQIQTVTVTANTVNIALNGQQVAAKGENYTLADGTQVPYSISYNGTTYLPIRKVGELLGQDIYWDQATGTAGVGVESESGPITKGFYAECKTVPDFGKMFNAPLITISGPTIGETGFENYLFAYNVAQFNQSNINAYTTVLKQHGFEQQKESKMENTVFSGMDQSGTVVFVLSTGYIIVDQKGLPQDVKSKQIFLSEFSSILSPENINPTIKITGRSKDDEYGSLQYTFEKDDVTVVFGFQTKNEETYFLVTII